MNVTRSRVALVSNMDRLWAIGGYDGMKNLSTVEMYNPETDEWSFVSSMQKHEGGVGVGVIPLEDVVTHQVKLQQGLEAAEDGMNNALRLTPLT